MPICARIGAARLPVQTRMPQKINPTIHVVIMPRRPWYQCATANSIDETRTAAHVENGKFASNSDRTAKTNPRYSELFRHPAQCTPDRRTDISPGGVARHDDLRESRQESAAFTRQARHGRKPGPLIGAQEAGQARLLSMPFLPGLSTVNPSLSRRSVPRAMARQNHGEQEAIGS